MAKKFHKIVLIIFALLFILIMILYCIQTS